MGVVYLAHNRILGRDEVLKVIGPEIVDSPEAFKRFNREIRTVARLQHPNIVTAYSAFRCGESLVFAMEYVDGLDLARMVRAKGPMPVEHASYFVHQAALGLQHAHEAGTVHRDIKPSNLMLANKSGRAVIKVLDFGLAKAGSEQDASEPVPAGAGDELTAADALTLRGQLLGTPDFIAPEQIDDAQKADIRADIYSLGCTLYYLLSGRPPFQSESIRETLRGHRSMLARPLDFVRPEVPAELSALVARMIAKEPADRYQTPREVADTLAPFFKKPAGAAVAPNFAVDRELPPATAGNAADPAAQTRDGMWSSLIDFSEDEIDPGAVSGAPYSARTPPRWLWPAGAAGVLLCAMVGAWTAGVFNGAAAKKDREQPSATDETLAASEPSKPLLPVPPQSSGTEPSPSTPVPGVPVLSDAEEKTSPPPAPLPPGRKDPPPIPKPPGLDRAFHEVASFSTKGPVIQARISPGSGTVFFETGGGNRALWRGDLKDPSNPKKVEAGVSGWVHLAISSDGRFAVSAGADNSLWKWDLETGQPPHRLLRPGRARITAMVLSPDDRLLAYVRDGAIHFRDVNKDEVSKKEASRSIGAQTNLIAFSPDGHRIVSSHADRSILVWDVETRQGVRTSTTQTPVSDLAVFPDGHRVLISYSGPTFICNLATSRKIRQAPGFGASIALSTDGRRALIGGGDSMRVWDVVTGEVLAQVDQKRTVLQVAFSADNRQAVSSTEEGIVVWALPPERSAVEETPVVEAGDFFKEGEDYSSVAFSPSGRWMLTGGMPFAVRLWDVGTRELKKSFIQERAETGAANPGVRATFSVAFSPKNENVALSGGSDGLVKLWDLASGESLLLYRHVDDVKTVAFSPDGRQAYAAGGQVFRADRWESGTDFAVRVWDLETGNQRRPMQGHKGTVCSVAVSTDGRYVLSGGADAVLILWDARAGREIRRFRGHTDAVHRVALLPNARRAVSCGGDRTIRLWDIDSGQEIRQHFKDESGFNWTLAVSADGRRLFSVDPFRHTLFYWDLDTGKLIQTLKLEERPEVGCFTPDSRHFVSGGRSGLLRMYRLQDLQEPPIAPPRRPPNPRR
jgi:WD40 repeat protein/serine/threonine protein kinase